MNKKEKKKIIKALRTEQDRLNKKYDNCNIYISISIEAITGEIMDVNPYSVDLRSGVYFGEDLITGEYKSVRLW